MHLFDHRGLQQPGVTHLGKKLCKLANCQVYDLLPLFFHKRGRSTYHQLEVTALNDFSLLQPRFMQLRFLKHPLDGTVEEYSVLKIGDLTVKPEMDSSNR